MNADHKLDKEYIATIREQIIACQNETMTYNSIFISSTVFTSILATIAAAIGVKFPQYDEIWNIFYLLPTIFMMALYNLIKYTTFQMKLGTYRKELEARINDYYGVKLLTWEQQLSTDKWYTFFGGGVQLLFYIPAMTLIMWGFWKIQHTILWYVMFVFIIMQAIVLFAMGVKLLNSTKKRRQSKNNIKEN